MLTPLAPADGDAILPLADARTHLNLTASDDYHDDAVTALRDAAISWAEGYAGRSLDSRQFLWRLDRFTSVVRLPIGPVSAVNAISYYASDGADTALVAADWYLGGDKLWAAHGATWPVASGAPGGVRITFTAGYALPADIPPYLLAAVKLAMAAMFEDRSSPDLTAAMRCADQFRPVTI